MRSMVPRMRTGGDSCAEASSAHISGAANSAAIPKHIPRARAVRIIAPPPSFDFLDARSRRAMLTTRSALLDGRAVPFLLRSRLT